MDHSPPGSSVHGVLQARILGWVAMPSSRGSSRPWEGRRDWTCVSYVSCIGRQVLYDYSHLGKEWVAIPFSSRSSQPGIEPRSSALQVDSLPSEPPQEPSNRWQKQAWETETCPAAPGDSVSSCHWERKKPGWSAWSEVEFFCLVLSGILTKGRQNTCQAGQSTQGTEEWRRACPALKDLTVNWTDRGSIS